MPPSPSRSPPPQLPSSPRHARRIRLRQQQQQHVFRNPIQFTFGHPFHITQGNKKRDFGNILNRNDIKEKYFKILF